MGNEIYQVCSCKDSIENPIKEKCLSNDPTKPDVVKAQNTSRINSNKSILLPLEDTRHSSLSWNFSSIKPVNLKYDQMCHYIGDTQNGKKQGKGKLLFSDGSYYEGDFKDDLYTGVGTLHLKEYRYVGEFFNGKKQGKGKIEYFVEKKVYEGEFMDDLPSGFGKEIYENGVIYEGFFVNGKKHNKGKLTLANGGEYIGEFKNDSLEGNGYFKWNETKNYKGQWKENCIDGFGVFTDGDKKYIGYFEKDLKNGLGANYYVNNNVYIVSRWKEDKIEDGIAIVFDREGKEDIVKIENNIIAKKYTEEEVLNNRIKESVSYLDLKRFYDEKILSGFYCNINFE